MSVLCTKQERKRVSTHLAANWDFSACESYDMPNKPTGLHRTITAVLKSCYNSE